MKRFIRWIELLFDCLVKVISNASIIRKSNINDAYLFLFDDNSRNNSSKKNFEEVDNE
jgi:hypothetical protein